MQLDNCENCGKVFIKKFENLCPACIKIRFIEIQKLKGWISTCPNPSFSNVEELTGVNPKNLRNYIMESRINTYGKLKATCEICGTNITVKSKHIVCSICMKKLVDSNGGIHSCFYSKDEE